MNMETKSDASLQLSASSLRINGQSEIILCASLFYFRIPRALWRDRIEQVKAFGYNAIDVYFPWNYHEREEGSWDFTGERDAEAFLQLAKEAGLWVVARPGPYICSEWDGGGLPAYLFAKEHMVIRSADPAYMGAVKKWYDRIIPMLANYELSRGGTVICVQLENELDFYDCPDPAAYIAGLRDMALGGGIEVPLIACAGQGGLYEASGLVEGVVPTCNFYPNDRDPAFEAKAASYGQRLAGMNVPLMVTETNRSHFLLRRLLSCGAKLIGPYLQVSGTNFGFTNGTNNWGDPLAFMTSDYDFHGMISPEGHVRKEAYEGRLMRRVITVYGTALAEAESAPASEAASIDGGQQTGGTLLERRLRLPDGGSLLFLANVGESAESVHLQLRSEGERVVPQASRLQSVPNRCIVLPVSVPLNGWGFEGTLLYATAELSDAKQTANRTAMVFHAEAEGEIALELGQGASFSARDGMTVEHQTENGELVLAFRAEAGQMAACRIELADGRELTVFGLAREDALLLARIEEDGRLAFEPGFEYDTAPRELNVDWTVANLLPAETMSAEPAIRTGKAEYLEENGIYRGFAWYKAVGGAPAGADVLGLLVHQGSDAVSLYAGSAYIGTCTPGGGSRYLPSAGIGGGELTARVEMWGHTNFDDPRLPALRLNSKKGLQGITAVTSRQRLSSNWRVRRVHSGNVDPDFLRNDRDDSEWASVSFGGWLSPDHPAFEYYRRRFTASGTADSFTLHFKGIQALAQVYVNGATAGSVHPFDPFVDISAHVKPGEEVQITVFLQRVLGLPAGEVTLYEGNAARDWELSACDEDGLLANAQRHAAAASASELPLRLEPGSVAWLFGALPDGARDVPGGWRVQVEGSGMKLTAALNGTIVGRLWLEGGASRPVLSGGDQRSFYLPGAWMREGGNGLTILLEAVEAGADSQLDRLIFTPVGEIVQRSSEEEG
ncbi:beta-galactosidase [Paenibacillus sacheonensis]|uniref:Glycoside hydrolase 35 catalytic domain-containing protein n=1 Tax=Paenibacillus sacheonensis TaxID=742054 RepID=A0A7X5BXG3_9BACL|nr:beta-galactosidase [Paenibacillus sacheonensis]MBM7568246.1 beta-galactosidase [Paenibacillus sacheonensis]NBC68567.1 hypothetical protein [Paenibacillus sacheonensis]